MRGPQCAPMRNLEKLPLIQYGKNFGIIRHYKFNKEKSSNISGRAQALFGRAGIVSCRAAPCPAIPWRRRQWRYRSTPFPHGMSIQLSYLDNLD